ncbi:DMT family transporter [Microbacterium aurum]|uniref:EamA family transporter n=1 Tax=Microbacterium aurum TaxID=36805 RepID=UPI001EF549E5|nr:EamA family transporter [Microbacterium aurum]MCG7414940.1 DMT family transporter [Microbacterium aurum]
MSAVLAFVGALVYGSADFLGGLAARRLRPLVVTGVAAASGAVLLGILAPIAGGTPTAADLLWGALSGVTGAVAIGLLYACLARGPMSVLSPVTAVVSAAAPMLWGLLAGGERLGAGSAAGLIVALVAIVLVALLPGERITRPTAPALAMAVGSGLAIGAFLILLDQTGEGSGIAPLVLNRVVNAVLTGGLATVLVVRAVRSGRGAQSAVRASGALPLPLRSAWLLAITCGVVDATANLLLLWALRAGGDLVVVAALTAMYPAGTVLLAAALLRERIAPVQGIGLVLALAAGILLAVG